jgi:pimeloyl-ACP methyl ester carboxylesterase
MTVLRDHPDGVRSAILDAPFFPENPGTEDWPWLVEREVKDIFVWCRRDPICNNEHPDTLRMFEARVAQWMQAGAARIGGRTYQLPDISAYLLRALYDPHRAAHLPDYLRALVEDRDDDLAAVVDHDGGRAELQSALVVCGEEAPFESVAQMRENAGNGVIAQLVIAEYLEDECSELALAEPDPIENQPVRSDVPILALAAEIDPGCPVEYALSAARFLPNAQVVELRGRTHAVTQVSSCGRQLMAAFLTDPTKPVDSSCAR